jgi:hypothetical protein
MDDKTDEGTHGFRGGFISHPNILYYLFEFPTTKFSQKSISPTP